MSLTRENLVRRLKEHEDSYVERKKSAQRDPVKKTLVALANSLPTGREAVLYLGVADDGEILGLGNADDIQKKVRSWCVKECYPEIQYTTELLTIDGKTVLAIVVHPSERKPHFTGRAYVRRGTENIEASDEMYREMVYSHTAKVAELMRYRGMTVTVFTEKYRPGIPDFKPRDGYLARYECEILDVNAHFVKMAMSDGSLRFTEPLMNIVISQDEEENRPLLIVTKEGA